MTDREFSNLKLRLIVSFFVTVICLQIVIGFIFYILNVVLAINNLTVIASEIIVSSVFIFFIAKNYVNILVKKIQESNSMTKEFISNAAHELRMPMTLIQTNIELATKSGDYDKYLKQARAEIKDANEFVNKLLQLSNIEKPSVANALDLEELLDDSIASLSPFVESKNLSFQKVLHHKKIEGDEVLILMMLNNLLENAVKYSPKNGEITIQSDEKCLFISNESKQIKDTKKLSERFYRERQNVKGHGIGLSIVQKVVDIHKWDLNLKFEKGYFKAIISY